MTLQRCFLATSAHFSFPKVMKSLVKFWKAQVIKISVCVYYVLESAEKEQVKRDNEPTTEIAKVFPMNTDVLLQASITTGLRVSTLIFQRKIIICNSFSG